MQRRYLGTFGFMEAEVAKLHLQQKNNIDLEQEYFSCHIPIDLGRPFDIEFFSARLSRFPVRYRWHVSQSLLERGVYINGI